MTFSFLNRVLMFPSSLSTRNRSCSLFWQFLTSLMNTESPRIPDSAMAALDPPSPRRIRSPASDRPKPASDPRVGAPDKPRKRLRPPRFGTPKSDRNRTNKVVPQDWRDEKEMSCSVDGGSAKMKKRKVDYISLLFSFFVYLFFFLPGFNINKSELKIGEICLTFSNDSSTGRSTYLLRGWLGSVTAM